MKVKLCPTLCDPMDCSLPGSSTHGIFQARVLERVSISFSRGSSRPRDRTLVSCTAGRRFTIWPTRETWKTPRHILIKLTKIKHKEQILKAAREKQQITHKGIPIRITADFSIETLQARREQQNIKRWKRKPDNPDYCIQQESHSNMKEKSKASQTSKSWANSAPLNQLFNKC